MNLSPPSLGNYATTTTSSSRAAPNSDPEYNNSSAPPSRHLPPQNNSNPFSINVPDYNTTQQSETTSMMDTGWMYGNSMAGGSVDISRWMIGNFAPATDDDISLTAPKVKEAQVKAQGILDYVQNVLPPLSEITSNAPAMAQQYKRRRTKLRASSVKDEDDEAGPRRRKRSVAIEQAPPSDPSMYPRQIAHEIRKLTNEDFEISCEWCPFYLNEPFNYFHKPWTSCTKQRAEISHIITHIVSDHGLIRGNNPKRTNQRYLTRCSSHMAEKKGKADCITCSKVEGWTERELNDRRHEGPSVCLRCYTEFRTKPELYEHLHQPSICLYKEDLLMMAKSRTLYEVFCAENEVPKFRPPPETSAPRDGARKRNMKGGRRVAGEASGPAQGSTRPAHPRPPRPILQQSPSPLPPSLTLSPSSQQDTNTDFSGEDRPTNFFAPTQVTPAQQKPQPTQFMPPPPAFISRHPLPSRTSDYDQTADLDLGPTYPTFHPTIQMSQCEDPSPLHITSMESRFLQPPAIQLVGNKYHGYDSGVGSEMAIRSQPTYEEQAYPPDDPYNPNSNIMNGSGSFFDDAWNQGVWWLPDS